MEEEDESRLNNFQALNSPDVHYYIPCQSVTYILFAVFWIASLKDFELTICFQL